MFKDKNTKKFMIAILILMLISMILLTGAVFIIQKEYEKELYRFSSIVIDQVHEKYPEAEEESIKEMFQSKNSHQEILNQYGINIDNIGKVLKEGQVHHKISFVFCGIFFFTITIFLYLMFLYIKKEQEQTNQLIQYCKEILEGKDSLDIRDNTEGNFSKLRNYIYDMTVMLKEKNLMLEENQQKTEKLISDISHQLKTPLTSLTMMNDLLYMDISKDKKIEFLDTMKKELAKIEWMIKVVLNLSKLDSKTLLLQKNEILAFTMMKKVIENFTVLCEVTKSEIHLQCGENVKIICDEKWSGEAISNMIKNAIEHGSKNVWIRVEENALYTLIEIEDDGDGIDKEDLPHVFERFYQTKNSKEGSMGLGLAFAKSIVLHQKGDLKVRSKKGSGTIFTVKFYKKMEKIL